MADGGLAGGHGSLPGPLSGAGDVVCPGQTPAEVASKPYLVSRYSGPSASVRVTMGQAGQQRTRDMGAPRHWVGTRAVVAVRMQQPTPIGPL